MIFLRRGVTASSRFVVLRVGLFFLAAGLWLGGVTIGDDRVTTVAIVVAVGALLFGLALRRWGAGEEAGKE